MSISLKKGEKISLKKAEIPLKNIMIGLGWDTTIRGGFFKRLFSSDKIDCDSSVILLKDDKLKLIQDVVYFGNLKHSSNAVRHSGDNLTGKGDGDDERIFVKLDKIPAEYNRLVFVANIYDAKNRSQDFGMLSNAYIRIVNTDNNTEICKYNLNDKYDGKTAMIFGEILKNQNEWEFNAIGLGTTDNSLQEMIKKYR